MTKFVQKALLSILFLTSTSLFGQNVQIIEQYNSIQEETESFECIDGKFNLDKGTKIALLSSTMRDADNFDLISMFTSFWKAANYIGANAFIVNKYERSSDATYIELLVYYLDTEALRENMDLYPKNMIYVLGDPDAVDGNVRNLKFNKEKVWLAPMEYIAYQNPVGEYATINIGGFLGAKVQILGQENRLPMLLAFGGLRVAPSVSGPGNGGLSVSVGQIYPVDLNLGQFLLSIYKERK